MKMIVESIWKLFERNIVICCFVSKTNGSHFEKTLCNVSTNYMYSYSLTINTVYLFIVHRSVYINIYLYMQV